ncbi:hypothetical protein AGMMS49982_01420 [Bacteroidia bacterium]|nr:hypothetical protein AGMMS49982_01420 [Bacteroidia bacterium]
MKLIKIFSVMFFLSLLFAPTFLPAQKKAKKESKKEMTVEDYEREKKLLKAKRASKSAEIPCQEYDTDELFVGTGKSRVRADKVNTDEYTKLLRSCQQLIKSKIGGKYQAVVRDYFDQMDIDGKSSVGSHIESAGELVIDRYLNDTKQTCQEETEEDDQGYVTIYMSVAIDKGDLAGAVASGISKEVSEDQATKVRFNEQKFRESALKAFEGK